MKKIPLFILIIFFLFPLSKGHAGESLYINGYDWEKRSIDSKIAFVEGWGKCGKVAIDSFPLFLDKFDESIEYSNSTRAVFIDNGILLGNVTIGQITDTIDEIYSDPRVKMIDITEIMPLVSGRLMQGWTKNQLDEVIAFKVKLKRCEKEKGQFAEECGAIRKNRNSYLQNLKKK